MPLIRQGDVLLVPSKHTTIPSWMPQLPRLNGAVVLAYGEATGHSHSISSKAAALYGDRQNNLLLLVVTGHLPVELDHEEHGLAPLAQRMVPPGNYDVVLQREFDPYFGERFIAD